MASVYLNSHEYPLSRHPVTFGDIDGISEHWTLENIAIAGKLLRKPPIPIRFQDEHQMKKILSIIHDVIRYKDILSESLYNSGFYEHNAQLRFDEKRVWLLFFELYIRHFLERPAAEANLQGLIFHEAELDEIATCLWKHRIHLAAAIARHRIKNQALQLSDVLWSNPKTERDVDGRNNFDPAAASDKEM